MPAEASVAARVKADTRAITERTQVVPSVVKKLTIGMLNPLHRQRAPAQCLSLRLQQFRCGYTHKETVPSLHMQDGASEADVHTDVTKLLRQHRTTLRGK